jgi:8-amino-7-oxononanoate synthase
VSALDFLDEELAGLEREHRRRVPRLVGGAQGARILLDGRPVTSFSSNDYLGLARHPALAVAARDAVDRFGVGAGASRLIVGNATVHAELEVAAARLVGMPAARLFNSGYAANTGLLPVLAGAGDEVFSDAHNHASIIDGCRLTRRVKVTVWPHLDLMFLDASLGRSQARRKFIVVESVFSMDGEIADLVALREIADRHGAVLIVDEAHGTGVFGTTGGGVLEDTGVRADVVVSTLGKALGAYGAIIAGPRALADLLWSRARPLVFTTGLPPMVAAAALAAVAVVGGPEGADLRARLRRRIRQLRDGLGISGESPIIPVVIGDDRETMACTARLLERGFYVQGIRPPTVPEGTSRLRVALSAAHSEEEVDGVVRAIRDVVPRGTVAG